jgi:hypothetical protein
MREHVVILRTDAADSGPLCECAMHDWPTVPTKPPTQQRSGSRPSQRRQQTHRRGLFMDEAAVGRYRLIEVIGEGGMGKVYYDQGGRADAQAAQRENAVGA